MKKTGKYDDLILGREERDLVVALPVALIEKVGGLPQAMFVRQAAYLSALKRKGGGDGFFDLPAEGSRNPHGKNVFARLGSWEALGIRRHALKSARAKALKLGLLEEVRRGPHNRLHYRIDMKRYAALLEECGCLNQEALADFKSGSATDRERAAPLNPATMNAENIKTDCRNLQSIPENNRENPDRDHVVVTELVDQGVRRRTAEAWLKIRRRKRKQISDDVIAHLKRESELAGLSLVSVVELCVERDWAGFEARWLDRKNPREHFGMPAAFKPFEPKAPQTRPERAMGVKRIEKMISQLTGCDGRY